MQQFPALALADVFNFLGDVFEVRLSCPTRTQQFRIADGPLEEVLFVKFDGTHASIIVWCKMTGMGTTTGLMTFEEFERLPDHEESLKLELLDGELIQMPPAITAHMRIVKQFFVILMRGVELLQKTGQARNLGEVFSETGYRLGRDWLVPDVSITHAGQAESKYLEGAPALAVEVISESNTAKRMHKKIVAYIENGAREVWLVYPDTRSVMIHRGKTATEVSGILTTDLLPGFSIDLAEVFGPE